MPLDLHVLSLPLAFILSQDQTLRCYILFILFPTKYFRHDPKVSPTFVCLDPSVSLLSWNLDGNCSFPLYSQLDCFQSRCLSCGKISLFYSHRDSVSTEIFKSWLLCRFLVCGCKVIAFFAAVQIFLQQFFNKKVYSLINH